jgi:acylphosphatase
MTNDLGFGQCGLVIYRGNPVMSVERESQFVRRRVIYSGRVQGVGFRYSTNSIARRHPVSGYVRNCADGTVELEVQGVGSDVDVFLAEISRRFEGYIADRDVNELPSIGDAEGFSIRY